MHYAYYGVFIYILSILQHVDYQYLIYYHSLSFAAIQPTYQLQDRQTLTDINYAMLIKMGDIGTISVYDRHGRAQRDRTPTNEDGRDLLRYGRTSCHHDFYNQKDVQKVQRIFINS